MKRFGGGVATLALLGAAAAVSAAIVVQNERPAPAAAAVAQEAPAGPVCAVAIPAAETTGEEAAMDVTGVRAAAIPPIDAEAPAKTERATFALG